MRRLELDEKPEERIEHEPCAPSAAAIPVCMPTYEASAEGEQPPHKEGTTMPETVLRMGTAGKSVKALWDKGAYYNVMSVDALHRQ